MTVPIIDNWTRVAGTVEDVVAIERPAGHVTIMVRLAVVEDVNGFPNLLRANIGDVITVLARSRPDDWQAGMKVQGLVRRAGLSRIFAHPDQFTARN